MRELILAFLLPLMGCAVLDPPDSLERQVGTLHTPEMESAIKAAKPGEPRS